MLFGCFLGLVSSANGPTYPQVTCTTNQYYDPYSYSCKSTTNIFGTINSTNVTVDSNGNFTCTDPDNVPYYSIDSIDCSAPGCNNSFTLIGSSCFNTSDLTSFEQLGMSFSSNSLREQAAICYFSNLKHPYHCNTLANLYVLSNYDDNTVDGVNYNRLFQPSSKSKNENNYTFWISGIPWLSYMTTYTSVNEEEIIETVFGFNDVITIIMALYTKEGAFQGFKTLNDDFIFCGIKSSISEIWRLYGTSYSSQCTLNLSQIEYDYIDYIFEPFLLDGSYLRPLPVILPGSSTTIPYRRFYIKDLVSFDINMFTSNLALYFTLDDSKTLKLPYYEIEYTRTSLSTVDYTYITSYSMLSSKFWRAVIIVAAVFGALAFAYFLLRAFSYRQYVGYGDFGLFQIIVVVSELLHIAGLLLFFIAFVFSMYFLIFYKYTNNTFMFLPTEEQLRPLVILWYIGLACLSFSTLIKIYKQTCIDVYIIDWEQPKRKDVPVSSWRRILIANEFIRLFPKKFYSVFITILSLIFLLDGLNTEIVACPSPGKNFIDTGIRHKILLFAFSSFLMLIIIVAQWIIVNFVIWGVIGNPYTNFLDLCAMSNISVVIMFTKASGYYLHGRSVHVHADESPETLHNYLASEMGDSVGLRGLLPHSNEQVFEILLNYEFMTNIDDKYSAVSTKARSVIENQKVFSFSSVSMESINSFPLFNRFLCSFFEKAENFEVRPAPTTEQYLRLPPTVTDKSVFLIKGDKDFKETLIAGIQWTLLLFYALLFNVIYTETESVSLAGLIVCSLDIIITVLCNKFNKVNLAKKSLLDDKFFMS